MFNYLSLHLIFFQLSEGTIFYFLLVNQVSKYNLKYRRVSKITQLKKERYFGKVKNVVPVLPTTYYTHSLYYCSLKINKLNVSKITRKYYSLTWTL